MHKKHFFLSNNIAEARGFSPQKQGFDGHTLPSKDRAAQASMVKEQYVAVVNQIVTHLEEREKQGQPVANGIYVDLKMDKSFIPDSLGKQDSPKGATIMKVTDNGDENDVDVTVYVKKDKKDWLKNKVDDYSCKNTAKGKPCNERLIAPINGVVATDIRTLYLITQSVWMIDEEVHVYSFPLSSQYKRACSEIYMLNSDWDKVLKNEYSEDSIEFFSFIGDLMAKPNESCLYEITATCIDFILEHYNFDGVLYPSVQAEGQGMNICIKPDVVDSKISFAGAATEVIVRNGDNSQIHILGNTHMITKDSFEWVLTNDGKMFLQQIGLLAPSFQNTPIVIRSESLM